MFDYVLVFVGLYIVMDCFVLLGGCVCRLVLCCCLIHWVWDQIRCLVGLWCGCLCWFVDVFC